MVKFHKLLYSCFTLLFTLKVVTLLITAAETLQAFVNSDCVNQFVNQSVNFLVMSVIYVYYILLLLVSCIGIPFDILYFVS